MLFIRWNIVNYNGKSIFSFQFANYLSQFGKVLYIASEEGFGNFDQNPIKEDETPADAEIESKPDSVLKEGHID